MAALGRFADRVVRTAAAAAAWGGCVAVLEALGARGGGERGKRCLVIQGLCCGDL